MVQDETIKNILAVKPTKELSESYVSFDYKNFEEFKIPAITVHGRFQPPLHINHWNYISNAFCIANKVIILITNPNLTESKVKEASHRNMAENNPFTYEQRTEIFKYFFDTMGIPETKYEFRPFDITNDNSWSNLDKNIPNLVNTYGDWSKAKLEKFKKLGFKVIHSSIPKTIDVSGTSVREILKMDIPIGEKRRLLIEIGYMEAAVEGLFKVFGQRVKPILVTCYVSPDLDGVAGSIAYAEFLQKKGRPAIAGIFGEPHEEAKYILDRFGIGYPETLSDADGFEEIILVDSSDLIGMEGRVSPGKVIEIIDHRKINDASDFPNAKIQIELVGAAVTLVAEKFMNNSVSISRESAILLCGGILSNTLNFKASVTTDRDRNAFEWLNNMAKLPESFWKELFTAKSDLSGEKLIERIKCDFAWFEMGKKKVGIAQIEMIGAKELVTEREMEILQILNTIKEEKGLDYIFQSALELEAEKNLFVTDDAETKKLLERVLGIEFVGNVATREGLIMRKQIVPLLKAELES